MLAGKAYKVFLIITGLFYLLTANVVLGITTTAFAFFYFLKTTNENKKLVFSLLVLLLISFVSKSYYYLKLQKKLSSPVKLKGLVLSQSLKDNYLTANVLVFSLKDYKGNNLTHLKVFNLNLPKSQTQIKGNYIFATGILKEKTIYKNPGTNREKFLKSRNSLYYIKVPSFKNIELKPSFLFRAYKQIDSIKLDNKINTGVLKAIIFGDKSEIPLSLKNVLQKSGFYHLFVVSGLHFGIFFSFIYLILILVPIRKRYKTAIALLILPILLILNSFTPSTVRAFSMIFIYFLFSIFDIEVKPIDAVGVAGLTMVFLNPYHAHDPGFLLSFLITGAIISSINKETNYLITFLKINIIAFIASAPILVIYFHRINFLSPIMNIVATPILSLTIYSFPLTLLHIPFAKELQSIAVSTLLYLAEVGSRYSVEIYIPSAFTFFYLSLTALYSSLKINLKNTIVFFTVITISYLLYLLTPFKENLLIVPDTGQSQAIILKSNNKVFMFDCSTDYCAKTVLTPILKSMKINKIDYLFLSHFDSDHAGGIGEILKSFKVKNLLLPYKDTNSEKFCKAYSCAKQHKINMVFAKAKDRFNITKTKIQILHSSNKANKNSNSKSLVLLVKTKDKSILIPGDLDGNQLKKLCNKLEKTDILIAPHHGSKKAAIPCLALKTKPTLVVVCAGKYNRFNFPTKQFTNLFKNTKLITTGQKGYIEIKLK